MSRISEIKKVLLITFILNLSVSLLKIVYGYISNSVAILSDGFHSMFDGFSNIMGYTGMVIAGMPPDERHPYGHRKFETIFTVFIGVMIFITCFIVLKEALSSLFESRKPDVTTTSFVIMIFTIIVNISVNRYEIKMGRKLSSEFLIADASHTGSDVIVSLGVILGLLLTKMGIYVADAITGIVVGVIVAIIGYRILKSSADILVDTAVIDRDEICRIAMGVEGVIECHDVRTRGTAECVFVDLHVVVSDHMSVKTAHQIADSIEESLKRRLPSIKDIIIHIEPSTERRDEKVQ